MGRARNLANIVKDSGNILVTGKNHNKHMSSDSDQGQLWITHNNNEASTGTSIGMWGRSDGTGFSGGIHYVADTRGSEGAHAFYQYDGTTWVRNMTIAEAGQVLMPNQPAAVAYLINNPSTNGYSTGSDNVLGVGNGIQVAGDLILKHTHTNRNNFYSTSNGRFTAPVAGVYQFNASFLPETINGATTFHGGWAKNGVIPNGFEVWHPHSNRATISVSIVTPMAVNDYLTFKLSYGAMHQRYTQLSGHLIG